jgi:hypothetical protein
MVRTIVVAATTDIIKHTLKVAVTFFLMFSRICALSFFTLFEKETHCGKKVLIIETQPKIKISLSY